MKGQSVSTPPRQLDSDSPPASPPPPTPSPSTSPEVGKAHFDLPFSIEDNAARKGVDKGKGIKGKSKLKKKPGPGRPPSASSVQFSAASLSAAPQLSASAKTSVPSSPQLSAQATQHKTAAGRAMGERKQPRRPRRLLPGEEEVLNRYSGAFFAKRVAS
jgi:hypothetical protein